MKKMLWVDLETTGLSPEKENIIEVGVLITDVYLNSLKEFETIIYCPSHILDRVDDSIQAMHKELFPLVRASNITLEEAELQFYNLIKDNFTEKPVLCGSSVHFDRNFLRAQMPRVFGELHYRNFDVSTFKIEADLLGLPPWKDEVEKKHRAISDLRGSIRELKYYRNLFRS